MSRIPRRPLCPPSAILAVFFAAQTAARAAQAGPFRGQEWRDLFTGKAITCIVAAVALLVLSLLLRGLSKLISLGAFVVLAAGAFWFLRDAWGSRDRFLPGEWSALAEKTLGSPRAKAAWRSVESELSHASGETRARLEAGTDDARRSLSARLEAKAHELQKSGNRAEAEELLRLRTILAAGR